MSESEYIYTCHLLGSESFDTTSEKGFVGGDQPLGEDIQPPPERNECGKPPQLGEAQDPAHSLLITENSAEKTQALNSNASIKMYTCDDDETALNERSNGELPDYQTFSTIDVGTSGTARIATISIASKRRVWCAEVSDAMSSTEATISGQYVLAANGLNTDKTGSIIEYDTLQHSGNSSINSGQRDALIPENEHTFEFSSKDQQCVETDGNGVTNLNIADGGSVSAFCGEYVAWVDSPERESGDEPERGECCREAHCHKAKMALRNCRKLQNCKSFQFGNASQEIPNKKVRPEQLIRRLGTSVVMLPPPSDNENSRADQTDGISHRQFAIQTGSDASIKSSSVSPMIVENDIVTVKVMPEADIFFPRNSKLVESADLQPLSSKDNDDESQRLQSPKDSPPNPGDNAQLDSTNVPDCSLRNTHSNKLANFPAIEKSSFGSFQYARGVQDQPSRESHAAENDSYSMLQSRKDGSSKNYFQQRDNILRQKQAQGEHNDSLQTLNKGRDNSPFRLQTVEDESPGCSPTKLSVSPETLPQPKEGPFLSTTPLSKFACRVTTKPSAAILRLQEQLRRGLEYDSKKAKSKVKQLQDMLLTHEGGEEIVDPPLHNQQGCSVPSRADRKSSQDSKQAKPYRQWHRISKCVAAESRYIISSLPQPSSIPTLKRTERSAAIFKTKDSVSNNVSEIRIHPAESMSDNEIHMSNVKVGDELMSSPPIDEDSSFDSIVETAELNAQHSDIKKTDTIMEDWNKSSAGYACSPEHHALYTSHERDNCSRAQIDETLTATKNETEQLTALESGCKEKANILTPSRVTIDDVFLTEMMIPPFEQMLPLKESSSLKDKYMIAQNSRYITSVQYFPESPQIKPRNIGPKTNPDIKRVRPAVGSHFDSISGVSQVTGPPSPDIADFRTQTKTCRFHTPTRGPVLRTATRNRNRKQSPRQTVGSNNSGSASDNPSTSLGIPTHHERSISRAPTRNGLRHSSKQNLNGRHCSRPSRTSSRHADQVRALSKGVQYICIEPKDPQSQELEANGKHVFSRLRKTCGEAGHDLEIDKRSLLSQPPKSAKILRPDVACKLLQKVNRVHKTQQSRKYVDVQATVDYKGNLPGQLSFRKGQIIKQRSFLDTPTDGICYGYYRVGRLRKKRKGLFPTACVTAHIGNGTEEKTENMDHIGQETEL